MNGSSSNLPLLRTALRSMCKAVVLDLCVNIRLAKLYITSVMNADFGWTYTVRI